MAGSLQRVLDEFAPLGISGEGLAQYGIVALDVPAGADKSAAQRLLRQGKTDNWWDYEEGCITDEWVAADPGN